jgi:glycosyltransferase involved in cell wall biosynthesis
MKLSILMATLESREEMFSKIHSHIEDQIIANNLMDEVEIVIFSDSKQYPVGMKRNMLIEQAQGDFTCFVDDDDWVSDDYIKLLYNAILTPDIDCVGIKGLLVSDDLGNKEFIHSSMYKSYGQDRNYYYRPPNHLNPIKRSIASRFKFPVINRGEDTDWAMQVSNSGLLKKEAFVNKVVYYYRFQYADSETQGRGK